MSSPNIFDRKASILTVILMFVLIVSSGMMAVFVASDPELKSAFLLVRVGEMIAEYSVDEIDFDKLIEGGRRGMVDRLDRYSGYLTKDAFKRVDQESSGHYSGIGITIVPDERGLLVLAVRAKGPADLAGMMVGDIIYRIDSQVIVGLTADESTANLKGKEGTEVSVGVIRPPDSDTLDLKLIRKEIDYSSIDYVGVSSDSMLYIRLTGFDTGLADKLRANLDTLLNAHPHDLRGIVLDLRGNPGGFLQEAWQTASIFLPKNQFVVGTDGRSRWQSEVFRSENDDMTNGLPMAVLVDKYSASAAEILTGALHQAGRATTVGDTTFGKGLVQSFVRFPDGDGLRLTISRYYLDGGVYLNDFDSMLNEVGRGLPPDHYYQYEAYADLPRALEGSLLLQRFASTHSDLILDSNTTTIHLIHEFVVFAESNGFEFHSDVTDMIDGILADSVDYSYNGEIRKNLDRLGKISRGADRKEYLVHQDYIARRLKQLAIERTEGTASAYEKIVLIDDPAIHYAVEILKEGNS